MKILTRKEFSDLFNTYKQGLGDTNSPLWLPEQSDMIGHVKKIKSEWFICVNPIPERHGTLTSLNSIDLNYHAWCWQHCKGRVLCYSSDTDNDEEWYGFTVEDDIPLWLLRWA